VIQLTLMTGRLFEYSNCGSFVYHHFGLISEDVYSSDIGIARTWGELLLHFNEVDKIIEASVLAFIFCESKILRNDSSLLHLALIQNGGRLISHRPGDMADVERNIPVERVLKEYLGIHHSIRKYMVLKS